MITANSKHCFYLQIDNQEETFNNFEIKIILHFARLPLWFYLFQQT